MPNFRSIRLFGPGWKIMRSRTIATAAMPSAVVIALAATGSAMVRDVAVSTASVIAASAALRITRLAMKPKNPSPSQAPKSPCTFTVVPRGSVTDAPALYQSTKNSAISSRMPPTAATSSPRLSLPMSIGPILLDGSDRYLHPGRLQRVLEEHRDSHRADAARDRRDGPGALHGRLEVDSADDAALGPGRPDVDHGGAGFDHLARDQSRLPHGRHQHVPAAADLSQVARARVAHRD